jgi:catechol 2,3-dioxygenase-like lactoylglutathione lyase family enzyme
MIDVTRVDCIRVPVDDIDAANHVYGEVLGLPRNTHLDREDRVEFEAAGVVWDSGVCNGAGLSDPAGNRILHHRYVPYEH